jgi:hypothetical protein
MRFVIVFAVNDQPALVHFFQKRFVCAHHGYFDVRLSNKPPASFVAKCPTCKKPAAEREGYECTGKTNGPVPHVTMPRLEEFAEFEFPSFGGKGFQQAKRKSRMTRGFEMGPHRGGSRTK